MNEKRRFIRTVTVTGADMSVEPEELVDIATEYPFVEFGILVSRNNVLGGNRFPTRMWIEKLISAKIVQDAVFDRVIQLSLHVCGSYVKEILQQGNWAGLITNMPNNLCWFRRIQLNTHGRVHLYDREPFSNAAKILSDRGHQIIIQIDGSNDTECILSDAKADGNNIVGLYDLSSGNGVLPQSWQSCKSFTGYSGGLSPDNVQENIEKIAQVASSEIWIDAETHLRSNNDAQFDVEKVKKFLENVKPYVI